MPAPSLPPPLALVPLCLPRPAPGRGTRPVGLRTAPGSLLLAPQLDEALAGARLAREFRRALGVLVGVHADGQSVALKLVDGGGGEDPRGGFGLGLPRCRPVE